MPCLIMDAAEGRIEAGRAARTYLPIASVGHCRVDIVNQSPMLCKGNIDELTENRKECEDESKECVGASLHPGPLISDGPLPGWKI